MATKGNQAVLDNVEELDDDALLQAQQAILEQQKKVEQAIAARRENIKAKAFTEIKEAIDKHFQNIGAQALTDFLHDNEYIILPEPQVIKATGQGRRAIKEEDLLFTFVYTPEGGTREQTLKLDALSKMPQAKTQNSYKQIVKLRQKEFADIYKHFTAKGKKYIRTDDGLKWLKQFFPSVEKETLNAIED